MPRGNRFLISLALTAALAAPMAALGANTPPDDKDNRHDNNHRYYDKKHKDYHTWDHNEDQAYQRYQTEHHERRSFVQLNTTQRNAYWNWRHNNPDNR